MITWINLVIRKQNWNQTTVLTFKKQLWNHFSRTRLLAVYFLNLLMPRHCSSPDVSQLFCFYSLTLSLPYQAVCLISINSSRIVLTTSIFLQLCLPHFIQFYVIFKYSIFYLKMNWRFCLGHECKLGWGWNESSFRFIPVKGEPRNVISEAVNQCWCYAYSFSSISLLHWVSFLFIH